MNAYIHHFVYDFKTGVRERSKLLMYYLFPLVFFLLVGGLMTGLNPYFKDTMLPAMLLFGYMCPTLQLFPNALVGAREAGVFRSYRINGVPAAAIVSMPVLSAAVHMAILSRDPLRRGRTHVRRGDTRAYRGIRPRGRALLRRIRGDRRAHRHRLRLPARRQRSCARSSTSRRSSSAVSWCRCRSCPPRSSASPCSSPPRHCMRLFAWARHAERRCAAVALTRRPGLGDRAELPARRPAFPVGAAGERTHEEAVARPPRGHSLRDRRGCGALTCGCGAVADPWPVLLYSACRWHRQAE